MEYASALFSVNSTAYSICAGSDGSSGSGFLKKPKSQYLLISRGKRELLAENCAEAYNGVCWALRRKPPTQH